MPVKKHKGSKIKAKKPIDKKGGDKAPVKKEEGNFLVLSLAGKDIGAGTKLTVANVAKTSGSAVDYIRKLTSSRPEYLCIVEKKAIYSRYPQIVVKEIK